MYLPDLRRPGGRTRPHAASTRRDLPGGSLRQVEPFSREVRPPTGTDVRRPPGT